MHTPLAITPVAPAMVHLAAFVASGVAVAAVIVGVRRWWLGKLPVADAPVADRAGARQRDVRWRAAVALAAGVAAAAVLMPALVALRQLYALPGFGARLVVLLVALLLLLVAALLALLLADPGEDT